MRSLVHHGRRAHALAEGTPRWRRGTRPAEFEVHSGRRAASGRLGSHWRAAKLVIVQFHENFSPVDHLPPLDHLKPQKRSRFIGVLCGLPGGALNCRHVAGEVQVVPVEAHLPDPTRERKIIGLYRVPANQVHFLAHTVTKLA
jgi:hypothetical protein